MRNQVKRLPYNRDAWFWRVGPADQGDSRPLYSSAAGDVVQASDPRYTAFVAAGGIATSIASMDELKKVLVPQTVTRRQAKQALLLRGITWDQVTAAIDQIADATQRELIRIEANDSQNFERQRPALIAMGTALGLSADDLDELFTTADALE